MKTINASIDSNLQKETGRFVYAATITRKDGQVFGFIEHDAELVVPDDGITLKPQGGMKSSATKTTAKGTPSHQTFIGFLSSTEIDEDDLRAGMFDGAQVKIFMIDLDNPPASLQPGQVIYVGRFFIGEVKFVDGVFQAEIVSVANKLKVPVVEVTSPICRAEFGDSRCGVDLNAHKVTGTVTSVNSSTSLTIDTGGAYPQLRKYGFIQVVGGEYDGMKIDYVDASGDVYNLFVPNDIPITAGQSVEVYGGCDKVFETCQGYNNAINFQGEPKIPGADKWKAGAKEVL